MSEAINQPAYYNHDGKSSVINGKLSTPQSTVDYVEQLVGDSSVSYTNAEAIYLFNVVKYLSRFPVKSAEGKSTKVEDTEKAQWYLHRLMGTAETNSPAETITPVDDSIETVAGKVTYTLQDNTGTQLTDEYLQGLLDDNYFSGTEAYYVSDIIKGLTYYGMQSTSNRPDYLKLLVLSVGKLVEYEKAVASISEPEETTTTTSTTAPVANDMVPPTTTNEPAANNAPTSASAPASAPVESGPANGQ